MEQHDQIGDKQWDNLWASPKLVVDKRWYININYIKTLKNKIKLK